ncbi:uncharacterized protein LOC142225255 [Haematobia irritans]|uniref:uncharacterized protein LOC142225255 n=1 Tax=Haematobia irritans TaxID=7368 RepID=UPI003F50946E
MSNPNNLIRPPILTPPNNQPNNPNIPPIPPINHNAQSEADIINVVTRICREQCRNVVENMLNPNADISGIDQGIDERYRENLTDLDKVPDIVRCLREFSGNHTEFSSWKKSVERVLNLYESTRGTPKYFAILNVIRNKIIGAADAALESYNTPLNWESISRCLALHYADKRDLGTLEYQMTTLIQGNNTVQDFYQDVYTHLSLIINNISCMTIGKEAMDILIQTYRDKALDTFIRGLRGDLAKLLCIREPTTLPQALHLCLKMQNQNFRTEHAYGKNTKLPQHPKTNQNFRPQVSHRTHDAFLQVTSVPLRTQNIYQQHQPQYFNNNSQPLQYFNRNRQFPTQIQRYQNINPNHNNPPPRPLAPKPQPKPVPMEIDQSMQSRAVNYMNRPRQNNDFTGKRPPEQTYQQPQKFQRNFHIESTDQEINGQVHANEDELYYQQAMTYGIENNLQDFPEYVENVDSRLESSSLPYFEVKTSSGEVLRILVDTGSNKNYIQNSLVKSSHPNKVKFYAKSVGGKTAITHHTFLNLFGLKQINIKFFLLPVLTSFHAILGNDTLKSLSAVIYTAENYMTIGDNIKIRLKQQVSQSINNIQIRSDHMTKEQESKINQIIQKYPNLFSEPNESLTYTTSVKGEIRTNTDNPIYSRCYPYPMHLKDEVERQIKELLTQGIIRPSKSPYNSPVWIVPKKMDASGVKKFRVVIDYRKLNMVTVPDRYPIPEINEVLSQLGQNKFFSVIDLKSGFHQIPLKESDMEKTAFSVNNGKYEFTRLPFGLRNAPSIFQRALDDILREHIGKICYVYIDDIIIFGKDEQTHIENLEKVFHTLELSNMKVQLDKCEFLKTEVEFLGFLISDKGIRANPKKVETINKFPIPETIKDLRSFLGMSGFYRRFIKDYAKLAKPLTVLLRGEEGQMSKNMSSKNTEQSGRALRNKRKRNARDYLGNQNAEELSLWFREN